MERIPEFKLMSDVDAIHEYHKMHKGQTEGYVYLFEQFCGINSGTVIDLGCGTSDYLIALKQRFSDLNISGYDGSKEMIEFSKDNIKKHNCSIDLYCQQIEDITATSDVVTSNNTLHHFENPKNFWDTIARTAPRVFVMDLVRPHTKEQAEHIIKVTCGNQSKLFQKDYYNSLLAAFTKDEIRKQIKPLGLDFVVLESPSGLCFIVVYGDIIERE